MAWTRSCRRPPPNLHIDNPRHKSLNTRPPNLPTRHPNPKQRSQIIKQPLANGRLIAKLPTLVVPLFTGANGGGPGIRTPGTPTVRPGANSVAGLPPILQRHNALFPPLIKLNSPWILLNLTAILLPRRALLLVPNLLTVYPIFRPFPLQGATGRPPTGLLNGGKLERLHPTVLGRLTASHRSPLAPSSESPLGENGPHFPRTLLLA